MELKFDTPYSKRARYLTLDKTFNVFRAPIKPHIFFEERDRAFMTSAPSSVIHCDLSHIIGGDTPATAPLLLASYLRINPDEPLHLLSKASAEFLYVIQGSGNTLWDEGQISWKVGDVMLLPGGVQYMHTSDRGTNAIVWQCTNEPQIMFERATPDPDQDTVLEHTHFPRDLISSNLESISKTTQPDGSKSTAMLFSTDKMKPKGTTTPSMTLVLNTVDPGDHQPPHVHNSVAVTLIIEEDRAYSLVENEKIEWSQYATFITPARAAHSHHNESDSDRSLFLIVQDGGLYYHCRTIGFANVDGLP